MRGVAIILLVIGLPTFILGLILGGVIVWRINLGYSAVYDVIERCDGPNCKGYAEVITQMDGICNASASGSTYMAPYCQGPGTPNAFDPIAAIATDKSMIADLTAKKTDGEKLAKEISEKLANQTRKYDELNALYLEAIPNEVYCIGGKGFNVSLNYSIEHDNITTIGIPGAEQLEHYPREFCAICKFDDSYSISCRESRWYAQSQDEHDLCVPCDYMECWRTHEINNKYSIVENISIIVSSNQSFAFVPINKSWPQSVQVKAVEILRHNSCYMFPPMFNTYAPSGGGGTRLAGESYIYNSPPSSPTVVSPGSGGAPGPVTSVTCTGQEGVRCELSEDNTIRIVSNSSLGAKDSYVIVKVWG